MSRISRDRLEDEWVSVSQGARLMGVSRQRVYVLANEGRVRSAEIGKRHGGRGVLVLDLDSVLQCAEHDLGRRVQTHYLSPEAADERDHASSE